MTLKEFPLSERAARIPQPKPMPLIGNLPDIDANAPVQSLMRLARVHGPIFRLILGGRTITVLGSQELVNEACDEDRFEKKVHRPLEMIRDFAGDGLFTAYGDRDEGDEELCRSQVEPLAGAPDGLPPGDGKAAANPW